MDDVISRMSALGWRIRYLTVIEDRDPGDEQDETAEYWESTQTLVKCAESASSWRVAEVA